MNGFGLLTGLCAALFLALSYVFSGMAVRRYPGVSAFGLLCRTHIVMGVLSCAGLAMLMSPVIRTGFPSYAWPLFGSVGFYLLGQLGLFLAQRTVDASRVVPLLGLKLPLLAGLNTAVLPMLLAVPRETYTGIQWLAIAVMLAAAFCLNRTGGRIPLRGLLWILMTCLGYALSDTCIKEMMSAMTSLIPDGSDGAGIRRALLCAFLCYVLCGTVSALLLPFCRLPVTLRAPAVFRDMTPFAVFWLAAMLFLYLCFQEIGTVGGNMIQSTRGILAILIGRVVSRLGYTSLEAAMTRDVFIRRLLSAVLMVLAIVLFNLP